MKYVCGWLQIAAAARLWDGTGTFLFTSSAGIYAVDDGGQANEDSAVVRTGVSERNDRCGVGSRPGRRCAADRLDAWGSTAAFSCHGTSRRAASSACPKLLAWVQHR